MGKANEGWYRTRRIKCWPGKGHVGHWFYFFARTAAEAHRKSKDIVGSHRECHFVGQPAVAPLLKVEGRPGLFIEGRL